MGSYKCNRCIFKNRNGVCTLKNIHTDEVDYDCWFFKQFKESSDYDYDIEEEYYGEDE